MLQVPTAAPTPDNQRSLVDLIADIRAARERMSASNPHRAVLEQCGVALGELALRLRVEQTRARKQRALALTVLADMRKVLGEQPADGVFTVIDAWAEALALIEVAPQ